MRQINVAPAHLHVTFEGATVKPEDEIRYEGGSEPIEGTDGLDARSPDEEFIAAQPAVEILEPTRTNPATVQAGGTFDIVFTPTSPAITSWRSDSLVAAASTLFGGDSEGEAIVGEDGNRATVIMPEGTPEETYDIRARVTSAEDHTGQRIELRALTVAPPP